MRKLNGLQRGAVLLVAGLSLPAWAVVTDINSVRVQTRVFNDYPGSSLTVLPSGGSPGLGFVGFEETSYGAAPGVAGFANRHAAWLSADGGASDFLLSRNEGFDISMSIMLDAGTIAPDRTNRKEAGFLFLGPAGDGVFIIAGEGESAAFAGGLPFHGFGGSAYSAGTMTTMRMIYRPDDDPNPFDGDASTMEYILGGVSSGPKNFDNLENGIPDGTKLGAYVQSNPDEANPGDFVLAEFRSISIVPEPASLVLLALGALGIARRR